MELKLKFIGINENDVIATSGTLCTFDGSGYSNLEMLTSGPTVVFIAGKSYKCVGNSYSPYCDFEDTTSTQNRGYTPTVYDINGTSIGAPEVGKYYHCYKGEGYDRIALECDNPAHHGAFDYQ